MPPYRMIGIALGAIISLNLQSGVAGAVTDQTPAPASDSEILGKKPPATLATGSASNAAGTVGARNLLALYQPPCSSRIMDMCATVDAYQHATLAASQKSAHALWEHPLPAASPLSGALVLGDPEEKPARRPLTPAANQTLSDSDPTILAQVRFKF